MSRSLTLQAASRHDSFLQRTGRVLRIGYVPLLDCAPLVVAHGLGFFEKEGLATQLCRQPGWACVRDKMLYGALDAAHAPIGFLFAINAGATPNVGQCVSAFVLSAQGNAVTLSTALYERGIREVKDLEAEIRARRDHRITLGIVSHHSSHAHLLRAWLLQGGLDPEKDTRIVILPPQQMVEGLRAGHLDGFCAGEPWNTYAVHEGIGWIAADSSHLAPMHPEKVLLVHEDFALQHHEEHMSLLRAQRAACDWCADPGNRPELASFLRRWVFTDLPEKVITQALASELCPVFGGADLHAPTHQKAQWVMTQMRRHRLLPLRSNEAELVQGFRPDLFAQIG
jgi:ABC-type nitrate/sulfonate/bicarbonate transport system substrate-binding protein